MQSATYVKLNICNFANHLMIYLLRTTMNQVSTNQKSRTIINKRRKFGLLAISPIFVLAISFLFTGIYFGDFYKVPLLIIFLLTSAYALFITRGYGIQERIAFFSRGAGEKNLLFMVWIFVLAGAFANSAKAMGAIDSIVSLTLSLLPASLLLPGLFLTACFVSMSIGTSVGTIVALTPIAAGLSADTTFEVPLLVSPIVGGALFGDNLSFISDTTIAATRTQGCNLSDKFKVNFRIVLPAALLSFVIYALIGSGGDNNYAGESFSIGMLFDMLPYLVVLVAAIMGVDVLILLFWGILLTGAIGVGSGDFDVLGWFGAMAEGVSGMGELILISMIAGGLMELIRVNGGITYIIHRLTRRVNGKRGAELCIAALVGVTNLCTANNTIAILSVGKISNDIAERFNIDKRRSASLLDTFSCIVQGVIPYGAQLLMASGLATVSPVEIIPYLVYPMLLLMASLLAIYFRFPRKFAA